MRVFLAAAGEHASASPIVESLRGAQLAAITRHSGTMVAANLFNGFILVVALYPTSRFLAAVAWYGVLVAYLTPLMARLRHRGPYPAPRPAGAAVIRRAVINSGLLGAIWGASPLLFFNASEGVQFVVACVCVGMMCGGAFGMATIPAAAVAFVVPLGAGCLGALLFEALVPAHYLTAPLLTTYVAILIFGVSSHGRSFAEKVSAQLRAEAAARHDPLTGLANRAAFDEALDEALRRLDRYGERFALLRVDFDAFKAVNELHGRESGDQILRLTANRLLDVVERPGLIARTGGDEFSMIVRGALDVEQIAVLAVDVACRFDAPFALDNEIVQCRASVGVASAPSDGSDREALKRAAELSLDRDRIDMRDRGSLRPSVDAQDARHRRELTHDMRAALSRGEFFLVFQPIQNLLNGEVQAFEALVRWRHPRLGLIPPTHFIDIAENTGLIHELGEWILNEACREAASWTNEARIAVNVSGRQLCDASIQRIVERALSDSGLPARRLEVEVTESAALTATQEAGAALQSMHDRGVSIVLDDFGTGFSSFDHIRKLPVSRLKIDRSFVKGLPDDKKSGAIVSAVLHLAKALEIGVTAEGVETREQLAFLEKAGCPSGQGYHFARPLSPADARAYLAQQVRRRSDAA